MIMKNHWRSSISRHTVVESKPSLPLHAEEQIHTCHHRSDSRVLIVQCCLIHHWSWVASKKGHPICALLISHACQLRAQRKDVGPAMLHSALLPFNGSASSSSARSSSTAVAASHSLAEPGLHRLANSNARSMARARLSRAASWQSLGSAWDAAASLLSRPLVSLRGQPTPPHGAGPAGGGV